MPPMPNTFLWFDLETFGRDARRSRIAQFAAQRTDSELNPLGAPISLYCQPARDLLPSPEAALITGITPQQAQRDGLIEAQFLARVHEALSEPGTCAVGYNSLRFDDEFLRFSLYRNFYDPYEREWRNGNSRWDLLDLLRLCYALRPDGIEWPLGADGRVSFKLELLARANGLEQTQAHEALSDVRALIALARLIRSAQPKLFDYYLGFRDKKRGAALLDPFKPKPLLHVSGRFPVEQRCAALVLPLAQDPVVATRVTVVDLAADPQALIEFDAEDVADRVFTPTADLPEGEARIPLKQIQTNRCPALVELAHLRPADIERMGLDVPRAQAHAERLLATEGLAEKVRRVFARDAARTPNDADAALYDGFPADSDKRRFASVRSARPDRLRALEGEFSDPRYRELLFRYRARNWPEALDTAELQRWNNYRRTRLCSDSGLCEHHFDSFRSEIAALRLAHAEDGAAQARLDALQDWGASIECEIT